MNLRLREEHQVEFTEIDFTGKLTINSISDWLQIIAANHASQLGISYYKDCGTVEYYWVLSRVKYVIDEYPKWEDHVAIETYPGGYNKLFAVRLFDLIDSKGKMWGYIIADYLLLDGQKKRPVRIKGAESPLDILDFPYEGERLEKVECVGTPIQEEIRKARYSELDLNQHMNNGHYIKWIMDILPLEFLRDKEISSLQVNYNTSVTYGEQVKIALIQVEEDDFRVCGTSLDGEVNYFTARVTVRN